MIAPLHDTTAVVTNNLPAFKRDFQQSIDAFLVSLGDKYKDALTERLRRGYRSGQFVTGDVAKSVRRSAPKTMKGGLRVVSVFTTDFKARLWEFGHFNKWTGRFEREPIWRVIATTQGQDFAAASLESFAIMKRTWNPEWKGSRPRKRTGRRAR